MTREDTLLQQALTAAREKRELTARDLFLDVVEINPRNETAWLWLTGLLDDLDECIYACEMVLDINPKNTQISPYLAKLRERKKDQQAEQIQTAEDHVKRALELANANRRREALGLVRDAAKVIDPGPEGWRLIADLSTSMSEQIHALERLLALTPNDTKSRERMNRLRHLKKNPYELAAIYEEQGEIDKAIDLYQSVMMLPKYKRRQREFDRKIIQLKVRRDEKIVYISPIISIARLAAGPALVYLFMLLIHVGINPFATSDPVLWMELLVTLFGGFLIAFASVPFHSRLWFLLFKDVSTSGTPLARASMMVVGWLLILLSFLHLFASAFARLIAYLTELTYQG
ncbi:MAG TPA: hypothetical protein VLA72_13820 [Anaerolineales bacterium]|nr:hypothetical protein [Anaerolineales bacterium]